MTFLKPFDSVPSAASLYRWQRQWTQAHLRRGDLSYILQEQINKIIKERDPEYFKKFCKTDVTHTNIC